MTAEPGIYHYIPATEYHRLDMLSSGQLKDASRSALEWAYRRANKKDESRPMESGKLAHIAILEPHRLENEVAVYDGVRRGKAWEQFQEENQGKVLVTQTLMHDAGKMVESVSTSDAADLFTDGKPEVTVIAELGGEMCRIRVDWLRDDGWLVDLKTTADPSPWAFQRNLIRMNGHIQVAFYNDVAAAAGIDVKGFRIVAVQNRPPWDVVLYDMESAIGPGRRAYEAAMETIRLAKESGLTPGVAPGVNGFEMPSWAMDDADAQLFEELGL